FACEYGESFTMLFADGQHLSLPFFASGGERLTIDCYEESDLFFPSPPVWMVRVLRCSLLDFNGSPSKWSGIVSSPARALCFFCRSLPTGDRNLLPQVRSGPGFV